MRAEGANVPGHDHRQRLFKSWVYQIGRAEDWTCTCGVRQNGANIQECGEVGDGGRRKW